MNISIIGASQGVGLEAVKRALDRGHNVITLSRSKVDVPDHANLTCIQGDATVKADVSAAIINAEAILVCLGTKPGGKTHTVCTDFTKLLLQLNAEKKIAVPVIIVSAFGAGESWNYSSLLLKALVKIFLKKAYSDKNAMENLIAASYLQWNVVRPGRLLDEPLTENYRIVDNLFDGIKIGGIARADVADYMLKQAEKPTELGKFVAILAGKQ